MKLLHISISLSFALLCSCYSMEKDRAEKQNQLISPQEANELHLKQLQLPLIEAICSNDPSQTWTAIDNITKQLDNEHLLNSKLTQYMPYTQLPSAGINAQKVFAKLDNAHDQEKQDIKTMTPLGFAVYLAKNQTEKNDQKIISYLLQNGASILASRGKSRLNPFHIAIKYNPDYILFLYRRDNILFEDDNLQMPIFTACSETAPLKSLETLVGLGFPLDMKDRASNITPLHVCAAKGFKNKAQCIIKKNAQNLIEQTDSVGATPLFYATKEKQIELIKLLLSYGARTDIQTKYDHTLIDYIPAPQQSNAADEKIALEIANLLIRSGAQLPSLQSHQQLLDSALTESLQETSTFYKTYVNALLHNEIEQLKAQIQSVKKEKLNRTDSSGLTPLHWAVIRNNEAVVQDILNQYTHNNFTIAGKEIPLISGLFANPIDINIADNNRLTPLGWAEKLGHTKIVQLLTKAGAQ
jgi:ankyrin repeat protein